MAHLTEIEKNALDAFKQRVLAVYPNARFGAVERLKESRRGVLEEYGDPEDLPEAQAWLFDESAFEVDVMLGREATMGEAPVQAVAQDVWLESEVYIVPLVVLDAL